MCIYIRYEETNFGFGSEAEHAQGSLMLALCPAMALAPILVALVGHAVSRIYSCDCSCDWSCDCWKERKARRERWGKFVRKHDIQCRAISGDQYTIANWTYVKDLCTELVKQNASLKCDTGMELVLEHPHQPNFDPKWGSKDRVYMLEGRLSVDNLLVMMVPKCTKQSRRQGGGGGSSSLKVAGADDNDSTSDSIHWSDLSDEDYENVSAEMNDLRSQLEQMQKMGQVNDQNGVEPRFVYEAIV